MLKAVDRLTRAVHFLAAVVCIPAIAAVIVLDVFCRYFLNAPLFWAQDVTTLILLLVFFGAQPLTYAEDDHIRMELFYGHFRPAMRRAVDVLSNLIIAFVSALFVYRLVGELLDPFSAGDTHGFLKVPLAPFRIAVVIAMLILILQAVVRTIALFGDRK